MNKRTHATIRHQLRVSHRLWLIVVSFLLPHKFQAEKQNCLSNGKMKRVFAKPEQCSITLTGVDRSGLGLAISRPIVRQQRGTIIAENDARGGACFTVTQPTDCWTGIGTT